MNRQRLAIILAAIAVAAMSGREGAAQALPTATQTFQLSLFAGGSLVETGLNDSRNLSITAGANLGLRSYFHVHPSVEVRLTYPVDQGNVVGEENALGGVKVEKRFGRFHPYVDFFFGEGELKYVKLYPDPHYFYYYQTSSSTVLAPGGGVDVDLSHHFAVKLDAQFERYSVPVTTSGSLFALPATVGLIYRFDFNEHRHRKDAVAKAPKTKGAPAVTAAPGAQTP